MRNRLNLIDRIRNSQRRVSELERISRVKFNFSMKELNDEKKKLSDMLFEQRSEYVKSLTSEETKRYDSIMLHFPMTDPRSAFDKAIDPPNFNYNPAY